MKNVDKGYRKESSGLGLCGEKSNYFCIHNLSIVCFGEVISCVAGRGEGGEALQYVCTCPVRPVQRGREEQVLLILYI